MIVKQSAAQRRPSPFAPLLRRRWLRRLAAAGGVVALVGASTLWGLYEGMQLYRNRVATELADLLDDVVATRLAIVPNWISGWWGADAKRLVLDIKHENFQKLAYQRELALQRGVLISGGEDEYVPARLGYGEQSVKVKVRLKGDWVDHLTGPKWSYRVKVRGEDTLFGMKNFSLQHPKARRFVYEWAFHEALAREDLLPLRYEFVELTVNGKDLGVYALEEHFDKRLVEHRNRREGPILKFDESLHWADILATGDTGNESPTGMRGFRAAAIDSFRAPSRAEEPDLWKVMVAATSVLEAFRAGEIAVAQAFDSRKLATYFALADVLGAEHAAVWHNFRFYYDPIATRLEPIGFDGNAGAPLHNVLGSKELLEEDRGGFRSRIFADPAFMAEYVAQLERVSDPAYLDALLADLGPGIERNLRILHKEFPWQRFDPEIFRANAKLIRNVLSPTQGLHAYLNASDPRHVELEIGNLSAFPIEILRARSGDVVLEPGAGAVVAASPPSQGVEWSALPLDVKGGAAWSEPLSETLELEYRMLGSSQLRQARVASRPRRLQLAEGDLLRRPPNAADFAFVEVDEAERVIAIRPGSWTIDRDLVVPPGYRFRCGAGTRLDLVGSSLIVSRSPLEFRGRPGDPVVIESSDGTGQGLFVLDAGGRSLLEHVAFQGLRNPDRDDWKLTGAVTFYRSPVRIAHSEFSNNASEDSLNLVRSPFEIEATIIRDTFSDAFDADFSDGSIRGSTFRDTGNDGIDVSGSRVTVSSVQIERAGDKGLSAGELSDLTIQDVQMDGGSIGVASKDRSSVHVEGLRLSGVKIGFALYVKKSEFGPATMEVRGASLENAETPYLLEEGSKLVLEGRGVAPNATGVYDRLYGPPHG
jgi:hypothetical protein